MSLQETIESYLRDIYLIETEKYNCAPSPLVKTQELAEKRAVSPASITEMVKKLSELGLLLHSPYRGMQLTERGRKIAIERIRRHRLWESYLYHALKLSLKDIHSEAQALEGRNSARLLESIEEQLNFPQHDPHGDPIPSRKGIFPERELSYSLAESLPQVQVRITHFKKQDPSFLSCVQQKQLSIHQLLWKKSSKYLQGSMLFSTEKGKLLFLPEEIALYILVTEDSKTNKRK